MTPNSASALLVCGVGSHWQGEPTRVWVSFHV